MNRAVKIVVGISVIGAAGYGAWLYYKKLKADQAATAQAALTPVAPTVNKARQDYCNPPVSAASAIERGQLVEQYRKDAALKEWDRRGRGVNPDYFIEQYKTEMACV